MKNFLLVTCLLIMSCSGCSKQEKGCTTVEPKSEEPQILAYAKADSLQIIKHSSGIYYQIVNPGSGATPTKESTITVGYTGKLLNGNTFDQSTGYTHKLNDLIEGWQIGIPLIKKGGRVKLIIPSAYGYGCNENQGIPSNSILYFDVSLIDTQ